MKENLLFIVSIPLRLLMILSFFLSAILGQLILKICDSDLYGNFFDVHFIVSKDFAKKVNIDLIKRK